MRASFVPGTNLAARTRRAWSEGRERERTPQWPDGEAVPPKSRVGAGSLGFAFQGGISRNWNHKIHKGVQCPQEIAVSQKKPPDFSDGLYSRDRTRTCDLRVMSPTSCQLLYPALTEPHYTEVKDLSQPVPALISKLGENGTIWDTFSLSMECSRTEWDKFRLFLALKIANGTI